MADVIQTKSYQGQTSPVTSTWTTAPTAGNPLVAVVNSATVVTTPAGWTARVSLVNSQGFYVYTKTAAGSSDTPSFTTSGNHQTSVTLIELDQTTVGVFDLGGTDTEASGTLTTHACPTITTTGTSGDLVFAVVACHGLAGAGTTFGTPATWNNSFTALLSSTLSNTGTGDSDAAAHFIATRNQSPAGAIGATTGTWPSGTSQAYGVQFAFKSISAGGTVTAVKMTATALAPVPAVTGGGTVTAVKATATALFPAPVASGGSTPATVNAVVATATGLFPAPSIDVTVTVTGGGPAAATALFPAPQVRAGATVVAVAQTATSAFPAPTVLTGVNVAAVKATATSLMPAPTVIGNIVVSAVPMTATGLVWAPFVMGDPIPVTVTAAPMSGTAVMYAPAISTEDLATHRLYLPTMRVPIGGRQRFGQLFFKQDVGVSLIKDSDSRWSLTQNPTQDLNLVTYVGGHDYYITGAAADELTAAGFGYLLTNIPGITPVESGYGSGPYGTGAYGVDTPGGVSDPDYGDGPYGDNIYG